METTEYGRLHSEKLRFRPVLALGPVDGENDEGPIVRFRVLDQNMLYERRGVYIVRAGAAVLYCGKYTSTFAKRWLYTRDRYVYHIKRTAIARCIEAGVDVTVFAETETELRRQLNSSGESVTIDRIEVDLIREFSPAWNRRR